jgi:hypothetical protein
MITPRKINAARVNGAKSLGPRTLRGKERSAKNSKKLGLSVPLSLSPSDHRLYGDLMDLFGGKNDDPEMRSAADAASHAQIHLEMVRQARRTAMVKASASFEQPAVFKKAIRLAASCERYEARAFSKRKKALRRLSEALSKLTERTQGSDAMPRAAPDG